MEYVLPHFLFNDGSTMTNVRNCFETVRLLALGPRASVCFTGFDRNKSAPQPGCVSIEKLCCVSLGNLLQLRIP